MKILRSIGVIAVFFINSVIYAQNIDTLSNEFIDKKFPENKTLFHVQEFSRVMNSKMISEDQTRMIINTKNKNERKRINVKRWISSIYLTYFLIFLSM